MTSKTLPNIMESELYMRGITTVIGVDEAGRGAIAGPVVCAAVSFDKGTPLIEGITDSKKITSESARFILYEKIIKTPGVSWYASVIPHDKIDEINILQATMLGMRTSINTVAKDRENCYALIDGNRLPPDCDCDATTVVKGDGKEYIIGCASIIAKVTRDTIMRHYDYEFPLYDFSSNKGYPTKLHKQTITDIGITTIHRKTFKIKNQANK